MASAGRAAARLATAHYRPVFPWCGGGALGTQAEATPFSEHVAAPLPSARAAGTIDAMPIPKASSAASMYRMVWTPLVVIRDKRELRRPDQILQHDMAIPLPIAQFHERAGIRPAATRADPTEPCSPPACIRR
jgi:hypothetical protein